MGDSRGSNMTTFIFAEGIDKEGWDYDVQTGEFSYCGVKISKDIGPYRLSDKIKRELELVVQYRKDKGIFGKKEEQ